MFKHRLLQSSSVVCLVTGNDAIEVVQLCGFCQCLVLQLRGQTVPPALLPAQDVEAVLAQYQALTEPDQLNHLNRIIACYQANDRAALKQAVFEQGLLPSKIKLLAILGNYVVTLQAAQASR